MVGKEKPTNLRCNVTFWNTNERFLIAGQLNCKIQTRHKTLVKGVTAISNAKLKYIPTNYKNSKKYCITKENDISPATKLKGQNIVIKLIKTSK